MRRREKGKGREDDRWPTLACIYLDTSVVMLDEELMGKVRSHISFGGSLSFCSC